MSFNGYERICERKMRVSIDWANMILSEQEVRRTYTCSDRACDVRRFTVDWKYKKITGRIPVGVCFLAKWQQITCGCLIVFFSSFEQTGLRRCKMYDARNKSKHRNPAKRNRICYMLRKIYTACHIILLHTHSGRQKVNLLNKDVIFKALTNGGYFFFRDGIIFYIFYLSTVLYWFCCLRLLTISG